NKGSIEGREPAVYFKEQFLDGDGWTSRWIESKHKSDFGKFVLSSGKFYGDEEKDKGLQTSQKARFYALSASFEPFSNKGQTLVVQFTVKHEQNIDCGGGYVKLFPNSLDQTDMHGDSEYNIMFGPDICGPGTKKVHVIFNYKGKNVLINKDIRCKDDEFTHLYTLIVRPDNTYEVKIDNSQVESGSLEDDWDFLPGSGDPSIYAYDNFGVLGLDLWQVKSGTIFDNFLITNDEAYAEEFGNETWGVTKAAEKQMKDKQDEEQRLK
uniref:Calreticulin,Calreticulin n=1 Tax=Homo sapiens TaxID=9606 RepID=UPI00084A2E81|nr:Chain A, Calreticulin,Calreticulin [Homo sapiens]5LK5_B Chain B, Calreticulin,Calreticulin [Homo sapiens]5LK5_C Chain C, Calreticulin,Calreticulin [Homo sapiens]5LK5_D Chain D, Calreticulin,Calreticulin [Homo sapiens]5LK5_E Chain E, Calreticulin,Calreticulin [Homo sapiens]5LK5_F Chain F, Calreticulin,Calreticulin [Homo sapiens]5LK5_G Chain G, Calreticulin,Calreticulin [Homo sapiens]5LK5_H Chain H, Calreticulin,Calreticulin [Homo sapiens]5LK5_I Chain I, Calreticulin,Calreticulin [Homo sap